MEMWQKIVVGGPGLRSSFIEGIRSHLDSWNSLLRGLERICDSPGKGQPLDEGVDSYQVLVVCMIDSAKDTNVLFTVIFNILSLILNSSS